MTKNKQYIIIRLNARNIINSMELTFTPNEICPIIIAVIEVSMVIPLVVIMEDSRYPKGFFFIISIPVKNANGTIKPRSNA